MRPDALLSVNPYYNRPSRRGIVRHFQEVNAATDLPILLYNIPQRTGADMSNDLLAELAQLTNIVGVKQANPDNVATSTGFSCMPATMTCWHRSWTWGRPAAS